jgi:hypothetical protein
MKEKQVETKGSLSATECGSSSMSSGKWRVGTDRASRFAWLARLPFMAGGRGFGAGDGVAGKMSLSKLMTALMSSLMALLEGRSHEAVRLMEETDTTREPEILVYFARHYSRIGLADSAVRALGRAAQLGSVCSPDTLNSDAWPSALREHPEFGSRLSTAETLVQEGRSSCAAYTAGPKNWLL